MKKFKKSLLFKNEDEERDFGRSLTAQNILTGIRPEVALFPKSEAYLSLHIYSNSRVFA